MAQKQIVLELKTETGATEKDLKNVAKGVEKVREEAEETSKETQKLGDDFSEMGGKLDSVTGGAITKFQGLTGMLKNTAKGFKTLRGAIISTGIGALVIAIASVTAAFTASEEGQNKFSKILKQIGVIAGNVGDIFSSLGTVILETLSGNFSAAGDAFDQLKERVVNFADETRGELELAGDLADKIADANKQERILLVERAKANVEINKLKTKAAEVDKFTNEERIKFLEQAAAKEDEITKKEVALATLRRDIKIEENSLSESTKEDLDEEAQLVANVIQLEEQRLLKNKELLGVASGLRKMEADAKTAERAAELAAIQKQSDDINQIKKQGADFEKGLVTDLSGLKKVVSEEEQAQDELTTNQKMALTSQALGGITALLGENSAAGKAAAVAQATINSYLAFTDVLKTPTTIPEPFGSIQKAISAAGILASGIATVKQITSVKTPSGGKGSKGAPAASAPPAFNVVGAAPESQLAQTIGEKEDKPVKAFVVSNDVTTAQSLDRNIIESASI